MRGLYLALVVVRVDDQHHNELFLDVSSDPDAVREQATHLALSKYPAGTVLAATAVRVPDHMVTLAAAELQAAADQPADQPSPEPTPDPQG